MSYLINSSPPLGISPFDQEDDFYDSLFSRDFALLTTEPSEFVINPDDEMLRSIHKDCILIESSGSASPSDMSETSESSMEAFKYEIRNHDCMWSGRCNDNDNNINNNIINDVLLNELEPSFWTKYQGNSNTTITTMNDNKNNIINNKQQQNSKLSMIPPKLATSQIAFGTTMMINQQQQQQQTQLQNIPPGTSLLLNSRLNQQKHNKVNNNNNNKLTISEVMLNENKNNKDNNIRPDTPLSLDDDPPAFKHSVDLAACIMGSNNICLENITDADKIIIRKLKEQLEDTTTEKIDIHNILPGVCGNNKTRSLTEVLNAIGSVENGGDSCNDLCEMGESGESDTEDEDFDDDDDDLLIKNNSTQFACNIPPPRQNIYSSTHSDHSYTRLKNGGVNVIGLGLETPSDSDEEIDVVSIGDKKLPTNPSDKDRRAIQTRVAKKISARIVKTPNGIKTIPPRRRCSYEPSTLVAKSKSKINSSSSYYGSVSSSAASTPNSLNYHRQSLSSSSSISSVSSSSASSTKSSMSLTNKYTTNTNSRKRSYASSKDDYIPTTTSSAKRHRGKKQKTTQKKHMGMNEADTIQKRNLHNNMERQRRIGLKNLFEALKRQIPNLKDKERAPKVIILREAAQICKQQITDEAILNEMKLTLKLQMQKNQELLAKLNMEKHKQRSSRSIIE